VTPARTALLLLPLLLCGCAGLFVDLPVREPYPLPLSLSRAELLRAWGPPRAIRREGDAEIWRYRSEHRRWVGVTPVVVVPLPLELPLAHERVEVRFADSGDVTATQTAIRGTRAFCTLFGGPCSDVPGCGWGRSRG